MLMDEQKNTLLHQAQTPEEIKLVLKSPLVDVDATNEVRKFLVDLFLTFDTRSHMLSDSQIPHARLITTRSPIYLGWPNAARNARTVA